MNEIQLFNNPDFGEIRSVQINNKPWFVGKDIAIALGYKNSRIAIQDNVDDEDKVVTKVTTNGGCQDTVCINESGVYALIFGSKLDKAKQFKHWVTSDVLPAIRQSGAYSVQPANQQALDIQLMNSRAALAGIYVALLNHVSTNSTSYKDILVACAANTAAGQPVLPLPKSQFGKTYSAGEVGKILGITANKVGRIANANGLKIDKFGEWYHDVTSHGKELDNFRYNDLAISKFREILNQ